MLHISQKFAQQVLDEIGLKGEAVSCNFVNDNSCCMIEITYEGESPSGAEYIDSFQRFGAKTWIIQVQVDTFIVNN